HEVVYDRIDLERRVELHHKVAEALKDDVAQMGVVAWHWTEAGQPERARGCFLKAAHHAAQRWALIDAQRYFLGALELFEPGSAPHIRIDFVEMVLSKGSDYELLETQVCKALETLQTHGDDEETQELRARAHTALGETLSRYGSQRYTEASQHTAQGLELANALGNISLRARALRTMGVLEVHQHDWSPESCERAMVVYRQASVLWQVLSDPVQEASIIFAIGSLHSNLNHRDDALNCYQHALRLQQANGDRKGEYITQFNLGWLHANEGRYTQAHQSYTAARAGFRSIGDRLSEAITLNNIGLLHSFRCDYRKAIEVYMASVELHRQLKTSSAAFSRINIALMYAYMGDFDRSMEWAQKVMDRIDQEREERRVPLRMILCLIECHRGNLDAALKLCQQELERLDSATFTGMHYSGMFWRMLAFIHCIRGNLDTAEEAALKAIDAEIVDKAVNNLIWARQDLCLVYIAQGSTKQARGVLDEVFQQLDQYPEDFQSFRARTHLLRARINRREGLYDAAQEDLDTSLRLYQKVHLRVETALVLCEQGLLAHDRGCDVVSWWTKAKHALEHLALYPESEAMLTMAKLEALLPNDASPNTPDASVQHT
ncbi:MAG: tetratricopeptide repeat protein, partial [Myxococcota bacterium]